MVFRASSFMTNAMASLDFPFSMFGTNSYITGNGSVSLLNNSAFVNYDIVSGIL